MTFQDKIVINIPLQNIWNSQGELNARRSSYLSEEKISEMLKCGLIDFVVADVGSSLKWVNQSECYSFWKCEVQDHLAENVEKINIDAFPNDYAYIASEWT